MFRPMALAVRHALALVVFSSLSSPVIAIRILAFRKIWYRAIAWC